MDSLKVDYQVTIAPTTEPIALTDLMSVSTGSYLRVDFTDDNAVLTSIISWCRAKAEDITGKSLAPQTIQAMWTLPQVNAGSLAGAKLLYDQDYYQYNESLGANPFSPAPFVLTMPRPPLVAVSLFEYRTTVFSAWQIWPTTNAGSSVLNYQAETLPTPGVVYLQYPPPAYQYRLTYTAGYSTLPPDLKMALIQMIAFKYENREAEDLPPELMNALISRKSWVL